VNNNKKIVVYVNAQSIDSAVEVSWGDLVFEPGVNALWSTTSNSLGRYSTTPAATVGDQRAYTWGQVAQLVAWFAEEAPAGTTLKTHWQVKEAFNLTTVLGGVATPDTYKVNWTKI